MFGRLNVMKPIHLAAATALVLGGLAFAFLPLAPAAASSAAADQAKGKTPDNWSYEMKNGRRVPKPGNRVTNADGSWREESRDGDCVIVREKTARGEYRETRSC